MKVRVSEPERDTLIEFTMTWLLERPDDIVEYAQTFFARMEETRHTRIYYEESESTSSSDDSFSSDSIPEVMPARRGVVYGESYDPNAEKEDFIKPVHPKTDEERATLEKVAKNTLIFRALDEEQLEDVINAMFKRKTHPGDMIIKQGDDGDNFYVIEKGVFDVFIAQPGGQSEHVFSYNNSGNFGELALLYNQPRAATVIAVTDGVIWALDRKTFRILVMQSAHQKREMYEKFIKTVPMLEQLGSYERLNLADVLAPKKFKRGERIMLEGDEADGMYFIEQGTVSVKKKNRSGKEIEIEKVKPGGYFGELALVTKKSRHASVYAETDIRLAFLDTEAFERFMGPCMDVMKRNVENYKQQVQALFGSDLNSSEESSSDSEPAQRGRPAQRRAVVFGESYDPNADKEEFIKPVHPKTDEERVVLEAVAKKTLLFRALDEEQFEDVINAMFKRETKPGDEIIKQGDDGDNFYVIEKGTFDVFIAKPGEKSEHVFSYDNSGNFGELALLYNQPRAATVIAVTDGVIWALDRRTFRKLVMQSAHEKRELYEQFIKTVPMLEQLGSYERLNLADVLIPRKFKSGDVIIKQGNEADGMFFIEQGVVSVKMKNPKGDEVEIDKLETGGYFGELALVTKKPRHASVYAETDTRLAFLDVEAFERFMGPCMDVMKRNIQQYEQQLRQLFGSASLTF